MILIAGLSTEHRLEARHIPSASCITPGILSWGGIEHSEEPLVAHVPAHRLGVLEQPAAHVEAGDWGLRVELADVPGIAAEHAGLDARGADHVIGHQQDVAALHPVAVLGHRRGQLRDGAGLGVALHQQVQHGHEVRLTRAEAAVQIGALVAVLLTDDGALDEAQGVLEAARELRGDDVILERPVDGLVLQTARQVEHEVPALDALGDVDEVLDERHGIAPYPK